jgi:uncharacterized protein
MPGLRFACQKGCTNCCNVHGFVYLSEEDVVRASAFLQMTPEAFEATYLIRYRKTVRLRKPLRSQCPFLKDSGCSIHPVKPTQCRLYPFWPELVETQAAWEGQREICPGIGKGPLVQIGSACEIADEMKQAYPGMYP